MVPTEARQPFHRDGWIYEEKIDGWRMLAYKDGRTVRLESRNGVDHTRRFPDLAAAVAALPGRTLVLDREVVIYDQELRSRFEWLREPNPAAVATPTLLMVFDLLYFDRRDITARPLRHRARLEDPDGADLPSRRDAAKKLGSISSRVVLHPPPTSTQKCPHRRREATRFRP